MCDRLLSYLAAFFLLFYMRVARMAGPRTQVQGLHHKMFCGGSPLPGATLYHCEMMF